MGARNASLDQVAQHQSDRLLQTIDDLRAYERSLRKPRDLEDDAFFFKTVKLAIELLDIVPADLQHGLLVSRTTISRWMNEECSPMPIGRPYVFDWLRKQSVRHRGQLLKRLRKLEADYPAIKSPNDRSSAPAKPARPPSRPGREKAAHRASDELREPR